MALNWPKITAGRTAVFEAVFSIIGLITMILGLSFLPSDNADMHTTIARKLLITEVVFLFLQLLLTFLLFFTQRENGCGPREFWLGFSVILLLAQLIVMILDATIAASVGIIYIGIGFTLSFVFKIGQMFFVMSALGYGSLDG